MNLGKVRWFVYITVLVTMMYGGMQLEFLGSTPLSLSVHAQSDDFEIDDAGAGGCCQYTSQCGNVNRWSCTLDDGEICDPVDRKRCKKRTN